MERQKELQKINKRLYGQVMSLIIFVFIAVIFYIITSFVTPDNTANTVKIFWSLYGVSTAAIFFTIREVYRERKNIENFYQENTNNTPE